MPRMLCELTELDMVLVLIVRLWLEQAGVTALRCAAGRNMVEMAHLLLCSKASLTAASAGVSVGCTVPH